MATVDMTQATESIQMDALDLVEFGTVVEKTPTSWSWITPSGNDIDLDGSGLTYNSTGEALSGTINLIAIDTGNDSPGNPDIRIGNIAADATRLDGGAVGFWSELLSGDDTILGPLIENVTDQRQSTLFGDGIRAPNGSVTGGDDLFRAGDSELVASGDVLSVGKDVAGALESDYRGGNDRIFTAPTEEFQSIAGDAIDVFASGRLTGGDDVMIIRSSSLIASAVGDAKRTSGLVNDVAEVIGGDDKISSEDGAAAELAGDVLQVFGHSRVLGGADTLKGGELDDNIAGDVTVVFSTSGVEIVGGDDTVFGNGGNDLLAGDLLVAQEALTITGGNDTINGGEGVDRIFGELAFGEASSIGGDDDLFGEAGDDEIFGQTGNDLLDGGTGADRLEGGLGNDTYVVDDIGDIIAERAGEGFDTVNTSLANFKLGDDFERLNSTGGGNFVGIGNALDNRFQSLGGNDRFVDVAGGADIFSGGAGTDTVDFRPSAVGVVLNFVTDVHGGAAAGDSYSSIEKFLGSDGAKDTMTAGGTGRFVFAGFGGNDVLTGGVKNDQLLGGDGNDTLLGGADRDALDGGAGTDRLDGGTGNDVLTGGLGVDTFVFAPGSGVDRVTDYNDAADLIDLTAFGFASFNQVRALASDAADGSLILDFGNGDKLDIDNFRLANFDAGDVLI